MSSVELYALPCRLANNIFQDLVYEERQSLNYIIYVYTISICLLCFSTCPRPSTPILSLQPLVTCCSSALKSTKSLQLQPNKNINKERGREKKKQKANCTKTKAKEVEETICVKSACLNFETYDKKKGNFLPQLTLRSF